MFGQRPNEHDAPPPHPHRHLGIPGLSSPFIRALAEASDRENIDELILRHASYLKSHWQKIKDLNLGRRIAILLLIMEEAKYLLQNRINALIETAGKRTIVILPLPPHLTEAFGPALNGNVISSDHELPHHLRFYPAKHIEYFLPDEIRQDFAGANAVVFEGYFEADALYVRRSVAKLLDLLNRQEIVFFVHPLPHRPPNTECTMLEPKSEVHII